MLAADLTQRTGRKEMKAKSSHWMSLSLTTHDGGHFILCNDFKKNSPNTITILRVFTKQREEFT